MSWVYLCSTSNIKLGFIAYINYISYKTMVQCSGFKIHFHSIVAQWFFVVILIYLFFVKPQVERKNLRILYFPNLRPAYHFILCSKISFKILFHIFLTSVSPNLGEQYICILFYNILFYRFRWGYMFAKVNQYSNSNFYISL